MVANSMLVTAVDERQASKLLGVAVQTLRNWRHLRRGPAYVKMGRSVRYQVKDLEAYLQRKKIDPELNIWSIRP
jgi:predicted DNA-binding transcriptional regulator AlpA